MDYKDKYIKYKLKYLELKNINLHYQYQNNIIGGFSKQIIHVSGPSGAGKTTLGKKLIEKYGDKILVKDIDDLRYEFIQNYYGNKKFKIIDKDAYQKYIDDYVDKIKKPLIFVGLNHMPWWHKELYYDMHPTYKFYINIDDKLVVKQKCMRLIKDLKNLENDEVAMNDLINYNKKFIKLTTNRIIEECDASQIIKLNKKWNKDYKKQNYIILSREEIYNEICKILDKKL